MCLAASGGAVGKAPNPEPEGEDAIFSIVVVSSFSHVNRCASAKGAALVLSPSLRVTLCGRQIRHSEQNTVLRENLFTLSSLNFAICSFSDSRVGCRLLRVTKKIIA